MNGEDLRGKPITVITVEDGTHFFFASDGSLSAATMADFPNGAHAIENVDTTTDVPLLCFVAGSLITTPDGERAVEYLSAGDLVMTDRGPATPILRMAHSHLTAAQLDSAPHLRPIRIRAHSFGPGLPVNDWRNELHFGTETVLVPAKCLPTHLASPDVVTGPVDYYHLLCAAHDMVRANGLWAESYQPARAALEALTPEARASFETRLPALLRAQLLRRPDRHYALKAYEAQLLGAPLQVAA